MLGTDDGSALVPSPRTALRMHPSLFIQRTSSCNPIWLDSKMACSRLARMADASAPRWRFVSFQSAEIEKLPGKTHYWYNKPGQVADTDLNFVRAQLPPGEAHQFHYHPRMEEILYILSGRAEQWVEKEHRVMGPGDAVYLPAGLIHGTYNTGREPLDFLAVLSPAKSDGPMTVEVSDQDPWKSLRS